MMTRFIIILLCVLTGLHATQDVNFDLSVFDTPTSSSEFNLNNNHVFLGLFGSGYRSMERDASQASFDAFYDTCKQQRSDLIDDSYLKSKFRELFDGLLCKNSYFEDRDAIIKRRKNNPAIRYSTDNKFNSRFLDNIDLVTQDSSVRLIPIRDSENCLSENQLDEVYETWVTHILSEEDSNLFDMKISRFNSDYLTRYYTFGSINFNTFKSIPRYQTVTNTSFLSDLHDFRNLTTAHSSYQGSFINTAFLFSNELASSFEEPYGLAYEAFMETNYPDGNITNITQNELNSLATTETIRLTFEQHSNRPNEILNGLTAIEKKLDSFTFIG